jgi:3-oxoacyl-[acyl-carrier-protein] synthase III
VYLSRLSAWRPDEVLSNQDLAHLVDTSDEWIFSHVGIRERRKSPVDMPVHEQGVRAARATMEGLNPTFIDLVICAFSVGDYHIPSTANLVAAELGIADAPAFDLRAACSSFAFALHTLRGMISSGLHKRALLVVPEVYTHATDYKDRNTCVLWGDASFACIVSREKPPGFSLEVLDTHIGSKSTDWRLIQIRHGGFFEQQGKAVHRFAIRKMSSIIEQQLKGEPVDWFVGHQANASILERACERAGLRPEQNLTNIAQFGNTGAAGAPTVLADNEHLFKNGERIVVATVGAGLSWGTALLLAHRGA